MLNQKYFKFWTWVCQSVSKEISFSEPKNQGKISSYSEYWIQGREYLYTHPLRTKCWGILDITWTWCRHKEICFWETRVVTVSYLVHYETLLQNATDIITNATAILLQNAKKIYYKICWYYIIKYDSFIARCDSHYKICRFYYKLWQLWQNATFITKCVGTYTFSKYPSLC